MGNSYKDLVIWQKSFALTKLVYKITAKLPKNELFGLVSQMQRCAVSVPSNIAEGHQRNNTKEYVQFLGISRGSLAELDTQLLIAREVYGLDISDALVLVTECQKMLSATVRTLRSKP